MVTILVLVKVKHIFLSLSLLYPTRSYPSAELDYTSGGICIWSTRRLNPLAANWVNYIIFINYLTCYHGSIQIMLLVLYCFQNYCGLIITRFKQFIKWYELFLPVTKFTVHWNIV